MSAYHFVDIIGNTYSEMFLLYCESNQSSKPVMTISISLLWSRRAVVSSGVRELKYLSVDLAFTEIGKSDPFT